MIEVELASMSTFLYGHALHSYVPSGHCLHSYGLHSYGLHSSGVFGHFFIGMAYIEYGLHSYVLCRQ